VKLARWLQGGWLLAQSVNLGVVATLAPCVSHRQAHRGSINSTLCALAGKRRHIA